MCWCGLLMNPRSARILFSLSMLMTFHITLDLLVTSWFQDGPHSGRHHRYVVICVQGKHTRTPQLRQSSFLLASVRFPQVPPLSLPRNDSCQSPALSYERGVSQTSMACCSLRHIRSLALSFRVEICNDCQD